MSRLFEKFDDGCCYQTAILSPTEIFNAITPSILSRYEAKTRQCQLNVKAWERILEIVVITHLHYIWELPSL